MSSSSTSSATTAALVVTISIRVIAILLVFVRISSPSSLTNAGVVATAIHSRSGRVDILPWMRTTCHHCRRRTGMLRHHVLRWAGVALSSVRTSLCPVGTAGEYHWTLTGVATARGRGATALGWHLTVVRSGVASPVLWHVLLLWRLLGLLLLLLWLLLSLLRSGIVGSLAGIHGGIVPTTGGAFSLLLPSLWKNWRQRWLLLLLLLGRGGRGAVWTRGILLSHVLVHYWHHA